MKVTRRLAQIHCVGDLEDGEAFTDRALLLNPNLFWAWLFSGWVKLSLGQPEVARERFARAMRLSPNDPTVLGIKDGMATTHFAAGRYAEALSWAKAAVREKPTFIVGICMAAASAALVGQLAEAESAVASLRQLDPKLCIADLKGQFRVLGRPEYFAKLAEGLQLAGLPEGWRDALLSSVPVFSVMLTVVSGWNNNSLEGF